MVEKRKNNPVSINIATHTNVEGRLVSQQLAMQTPKVTGEFPTSADQSLTISHRHFPPRLIVKHTILGEDGAEIALPKKNGGSSVEVRGFLDKGNTKITIVFPSELHPSK